MKKLVLILFVLIVVAASALLLFRQEQVYRLQSGEATIYNQSQNEVYYLRSGNGELEKFVLSGAKPETFTPLAVNWGKDDDLIFYKEKQVIGADAATFEVIDDSWAKDADTLYYQFIKISDTKQPLFKPFKEDGNFLANIISDGQTVYLYKPHRLSLRDTLIPIPELSPETLTFVEKSGFYLKDHDTVVYVNVNSDEAPHYEVLKSADAGTFIAEIGERFDAIDKNFKYRYGQTIEE